MFFSPEEIALRYANLPKIIFSDNLPVVQEYEAIVELINNNQVVVIAGETGSGKTTQLPKICLSMGRGVEGLIGHTQPRRIAALTIANRIAEELESPPGKYVGSKIRFNDTMQKSCYLKLMTDGILLAEIQTDRLLHQYDTIILDEAHERSVNIDVLMGYLKTILPKRPDLKLIITSATISPEKFSQFFNNAPMMTISGRMYPVDVRYIEYDNEEADYIPYAIEEAIKEGPGDILIFLSGEREIRITAESIKDMRLKQVEVLPLYARLSKAEQLKIFQPHSQSRRIILSTNVAETSLTVPNIRYVIDTGFARISRYQYRSKVQRLPIEAISQASANQRMGRCGRVQAGVCFRLYSEEDFLRRPEFTTPEILRTNLASLILLLFDLKIKEIENFPFLDLPDKKLIKDGLKLLEQLGAIGETKALTIIGQKLAKLPVEPKIGRMLLGGAEMHCLKEILIIASALAIQDPKEVPADKKEQARQAHAPYNHPQSEFLSYLNLWNDFHEHKEVLSNSKLRTKCRQNFISYLRMCEWMDVHQQLSNIAHEMGLKQNQVPASYESIHKALLTALLTTIGLKEKTTPYYFGPRGVKFKIFPGSALYKIKSDWIMVFEFLETREVYGLCVAKVEPDWIVAAAHDLVKYNYIDPHFEKKRNHIVALQKTSLFGLEIINNKRVDYGPVAPVIAREIFIRQGLVAGELNTQLPFYIENRKKCEAIDKLENQARRRDLFVEEEILFQFYDKLLPTNINSTYLLEKWHQTITSEEKNALYFDMALLTDNDSVSKSVASIENDYPKKITIKGKVFEVSYLFEPGSDADGATVHLTPDTLHYLKTEDFSWLVPGLLKERILALVRVLPKSYRRFFMPIESTVDKVYDLLELKIGKADLKESLAKILSELSGSIIHKTLLDESKIAPHLRMRYQMVLGEKLITSRDLAFLKSKAQEITTLAGQQTENIIDQTIRPENFATEILKQDIKTWEMGILPYHIDKIKAGMKVILYPGVIDNRQTCALGLFDKKENAIFFHAQGVTRLFIIAFQDKIQYVYKQMLSSYKLKFKQSGFLQLGLDYLTFEKIMPDICFVAIKALMVEDKPQVLSSSEFDARIAKYQHQVILLIMKVSEIIFNLIDNYLVLRKNSLQSNKNTNNSIFEEVAKQLSYLMYPGFIYKTPLAWLNRYTVYFSAIQQRLDNYFIKPARDESLNKTVKLFWQAYITKQDELTDKKIVNVDLQTFRWLIEEYRISLFAQQLKTILPVSQKRLIELWEKINTK